MHTRQHRFDGFLALAIPFLVVSLHVEIGISGKNLVLIFIHIFLPQLHRSVYFAHEIVHDIFGDIHADIVQFWKSVHYYVFTRTIIGNVSVQKTKNAFYFAV